MIRKSIFGGRSNHIGLHSILLVWICGWVSMGAIEMDYLASTDQELLGGWAHRRCSDSFRALIERYSGLVYLAAWRAGGDDAIAMEVSRAVFAGLAGLAGRFGRRPSLAGWLHGNTVAATRRLLAENRGDRANSASVRTAMECRQFAQADAWGALGPAIDGALAALSESDRDILLQRFYRMRSHNSLAAALDITAVAARKRVEQATTALLRNLEKHGCHTNGALTGLLAAGFEADARAGASLAGALVGPAMASIAAGGTKVSRFPSPGAAVTAGLAAAVALLCAGWWAAQARTIAAIEAEIDGMRESFARHESPPADEFADEPPSTALDASPVDWGLVARMLRQSRATSPVNPMARLEARIATMTAGEILAALDEIDRAELTDDERGQLQQRLCLALASTPDGHREVLDRYLPMIDRGTWSWTLGAHLGGWLDADPDAAVDWLAAHSQQIPELSWGFFPTAFYPRLAANPELCAKMLAAIPEDRRLEALRSLQIGQLDANELAAWARVVRDGLVGEEQTSAISWPVMSWSDGDGAPMSMGEVDDYLALLHPSPGELEACLLAAAAEGASATIRRAGAFSTVDAPQTRQQDKLIAWIEEMREWIDGRASSLVNRATGLGLAHPGHDFADSAALALHYHEEIRDDDLLIPLLERGPWDAGHRELAVELAGRLADPELRARFLDQYTSENP